MANGGSAVDVECWAELDVTTPLSTAGEIISDLSPSGRASGFRPGFIAKF